MPQGKHWTTANELLLVQLWTIPGITLVAMGRQLERSPYGVQAHARKLGLPMDKPVGSVHNLCGVKEWRFV